MGWSVLVVDDHRSFRREARAMLEADGLKVVGEAAGAAAALVETARLQPQVIVLDVGLSDGSGLDLVGPLRDLAPDVIVVLVSGRREADFGGRVAGTGADAFIEKARLRPGTIPELLVSLGNR